MKTLDKKIKLIFFIITSIICSIIIPWLVMLFGSYVLIPDPPKPEITYSEFPFQLEYEFNGDTFKVQDIFICEFDGYDFSTASGEKYRKWKGYFKSGNTRITLIKKENLEIYCFSVAEHWGSMAGRYMGDPDYSGRIYDNPPSIFYTDNFEEKVIDELVKDDEVWEKYKLRLISWEIAPPIQNTFK